MGADIWSLACIIFELFSGRTPFHCANEYDTFQKIINEEYNFPPNFDSEAKDLVTQMLRLNPNRRLGSGSTEEGLDMEALKAHPFFEGVDFRRIHETESPLIEIFERSETHHVEPFDELPDSLFETPEYHDEALQFTASIDQALGNPLARIPEADNEACSIESQSQLRLSGFGKQSSKPSAEVNPDLFSIEEEEKLQSKRHHSNVTDEEPHAFKRIIHTSSDGSSSEDEIESEVRNSRQISQSTKKVPILDLGG